MSLYFISYTFLPSSNSRAPTAPNNPFGSPAHQTGFGLASVIGCCVQSRSRHFGKSFQHLINRILKKKKEKRKKQLQVFLCLAGSRLVSVTDSVHAPLMCPSSSINVRASTPKNYDVRSLNVSFTTSPHIPLPPFFFLFCINIDPFDCVTRLARLHAVFVEERKTQSAAGVV